MELGIYKHYKGKRYLVIGISRHTETGEECVVYIPLYEHPEGGRPLQHRPLEMWNETVKWKGREVRRFLYDGDELEKKK